MGHRHMFNTPQIVESDNDQGWNYAVQPYLPVARGVSESNSISYPVDSMTIQSGHFPSMWTPASRSNGYSSSVLNGELPHSQAVAHDPSHDPYRNQPGPGDLHMHQDNYFHHASSSNMGGQTVHEMDSGFCDQTISNGKGPYKRKSPGVAPMCNNGSTSSRYYGAGSSSDIPLPVNPWQEAQSTESYHANWEYPPNFGINSISVGSEGALRNIRSRAAVDLEPNPVRTHLSDSVHASSSRSSDQPNSRDFWGHSLNVPMREWNQNFVQPTADELTFSPNSGFYSQDPSYLNSLNNQPNGSLEVGACNNDVSNRNHIAENVSSNFNRSVRGVRSGYGQRSAPTFRASSSNFFPGYSVASDEGQQMVAKSYPLRYPRHSSNLRLRNVDRIGRNHVSERYRASPEEGIVMDGATYYGSRSMVDQHRDMRLDIDNMSYEELIALGERIGSVSTGLSDAMISKCLTESIHCSSDIFEDDGSCVICLEEYKNMDDVGTLRGCGHDFHVGCVRKWLSMKNLCPICKAAAIDDQGTKGPSI